MPVGMDSPRPEVNMHQFSSNGTKNPPKTGVLLENVSNVSLAEDKRTPGTSNSHERTSDEETMAEERDLSTNFE